MPRTGVSPLGRVLEYFKSVPIEFLKEAKGLVDDIARERTQKSAAAKVRATRRVETPPRTAVAAPPRRAKKRKPRKAPLVPAVPTE
mgnify:CR=1 FL=1